MEWFERMLAAGCGSRERRSSKIVLLCPKVASQHSDTSNLSQQVPSPRDHLAERILILMISSIRVTWGMLEATHRYKGYT